MQVRWRTLVALGSLVVLTAGLGGGGAGPAGAADDEITYETPVRMPLGPAHGLFGGASEPSIALDADGGIYITAACCLPTAASAWYSRDGTSFDHLPSPATLRENTIGAEGDFVVDDADRPILADTRIPSIVVTRWRDGGDTWERSVDASEVTYILQDRPWLGWGQGALYLFVNGGLQNTYVYESFDEGLTWNPIPIGSFSGNFPTMMTASRQDGAIWLVGKNGFTGRDLVSSVSADHGQTWANGSVGRASRSGGTSPTIGLSVATDESGNGYAVWSTWDANGCDVEMASSTDHGQTWSEPVKVNATPGCASFPWVDAGLPGRVVVGWYQSDTERHQANMPAGATWHLHTAVSTDALAATPSFTEARMPGATIVRGNLTTGYGQPGSGARPVLDFFEVAAGPDGRFHVSYAERVSQGNQANTWYVRQGSGPLLHANRIADATTVSLTSALRDGDGLRVTGRTEFRRAPETELFPPLPDPATAAIAGGTVTRVGPDSDELLLTLTTPPNGVPGYDGLPGLNFSWPFRVKGQWHELTVNSREPDGPKFYLDGKRTGGTIDGVDGRAIARVSMAAVGAEPGDELLFRLPAPAGIQNSETASYAIPEATVALSILQGGQEVAGGTASLDEVMDSFEGLVDVAGLEPGTYEVVATACYAGACSSASASVEV